MSVIFRKENRVGKADFFWSAFFVFGGKHGKADSKADFPFRCFIDCSQQTNFVVAIKGDGLLKAIRGHPAKTTLIAVNCH